MPVMFPLARMKQIANIEESDQHSLLYPENSEMASEISLILNQAFKSEYIVVTHEPLLGHRA